MQIFLFFSFDISRLKNVYHHMVTFNAKIRYLFSLLLSLQMSKCNLAIKYSTIRLCLVAVVVIVIETLNFRCSEFTKFSESAFAIMASSSLLFLEEMCHLAFTSYIVCYQANLLSSSRSISSSIPFYLFCQNGMEWN